MGGKGVEWKLKQNGSSLPRASSCGTMEERSEWDIRKIKLK